MFGEKTREFQAMDKMKEILKKEISDKEKLKQIEQVFVWWDICVKEYWITSWGFAAKQQQREKEGD